MRLAVAALEGALLLAACSLNLAADEPSLLADDEKTLRAAGLDTDDASLLKYFRDRTPSVADRGRLAAWTTDLGHLSFAVREEAAAKLVKWGSQAVPFLKKALNDKDPEIARRAEACLQKIGDEGVRELTRSAARLLGARRPAGAVEAIFHYFPLADDDLQADLLLALEQAGSQAGEVPGVLLAALEHPEPLQRSVAARVVGRSPRGEQQDAVVPLLQDGAPLVRLRAAQGLLAGRRKEAVPPLIALLDEAPLPVAEEAEDWLLRLAGDHAPDVLLGKNADERRRCRQAWAAWWQIEQSRLKLADAALDYRRPRLPIIAPVGPNRRPDVIFVPTPQEVVERMLDLARIRKRDVVYDLGCGDGRVVVTAALKVGAYGFGFDIDPDRVREAEALVKKNRVERLVTIKQADVFTLDLKEATVIYLYLLPSLNVKLIPQLEKCRPGTRIVSHNFDMQGVQPDQVVPVRTKDGGEHRLYLWTMPLKRMR